MLPVAAGPSAAAVAADGAPKIPFIVGVTGHMDLDARQREKVEAVLQNFFDWLRADNGIVAPSPHAIQTTAGNGLANHPLNQLGLGLERTPLWLLSSLAPGADHWVAEFAKNKDNDRGRGRARVVAPLPFARDLYKRASTFQPAPSEPRSDPADPAEAARWEDHLRQRTEACESAAAFLDAMPSKDTFLVRLPGEECISDEALHTAQNDPELLTGPGRKAERDQRYGAAGEYVAAYCDLLLVLADPVDREQVAVQRQKNPGPRLPDVGAHGIADIRRRGLTPGRLPNPPMLTWADSGPVLRMKVYRRRTRPSDAKLAQVGDIEWLFPFDSRPLGMLAAADDNPVWHELGMRELREFTRNLEELNRAPSRSDPSKIAREWLSRLQPQPADPPPAIAPFPVDSEDTDAAVMREHLDRLGRLRRRVTDLNAYYDDQLKGLRRKLFTSALLAAVVLAGYDYWQFPAPVPPASGAFANLPFYRCVLFGLFLWFTLDSYRMLRQFRGEVLDRTRTDYRAIVEGLRVQFYWAAAGTGKSVASAYLQRQRGENAWIRATIASMAFPYERAAVAFAQLGARTQLALLRNVRHGWIDEQVRYFTTKRQEFQRRRHGWSEASLVLVWTALVLSVIGVLLTLFPTLKIFFLAVNQPLMVGGGLLAVGLGIWARILRPRVPTKLRKASNLSPPKNLGARLRAWRKRLPAPSAVLAAWFPEFGPGRSHRQRVASTGVGVLSLVMLMVGISFRLTEAFAVGTLPTANNILGICKAMSLTLGILAGLWVSVHFLTDNIRRYGEMAALFTAAGRRLNDHLGLLEQAIDAGEITLARQALRDSQRLIEELGREALHENSEWLSMHRNHPIEPVSG